MELCGQQTTEITELTCTGLKGKAARLDSLLLYNGISIDEQLIGAVVFFFSDLEATPQEVFKLFLIISIKSESLIHILLQTAWMFGYV